MPTALSCFQYDQKLKSKMFLASLLLFTPSPDLGTLKVRNMYSVHLDRWSFRWCRWLDSTISCTEYLQKRQIPEQKWICSKILSDNTPGMSEFLWISIFKIQKEISWHSWLDLHYVTPVHPTVQCGWLKCLSRAFFGTTIVLKITSRKSFELCSNNYQLECWFCVEQFTNFGSVNIMFNTIHTDGNPKKNLASWNLFQWLDLSSIFSHNQRALTYLASRILPYAAVASIPNNCLDGKITQFTCAWYIVNEALDIMLGWVWGKSNLYFPT